MTIREQLARELEQTPDAVVAEILDFCLFLKQRIAKKTINASSVSPSGILSFLAEIQAIQAEVPAEEWATLPHDGAINHDHYLYGAPKVEP